MLNFHSENFNGDAADSIIEESKQTGKSSSTPLIDEHCTDLTALAALGALDPVVAREDEVLRISQILCRRKKNNPVIIGEPGVGKSAIVEGLATMISENRVPPMLASKRIVAIEMSSLVAGTQYRGQFEARIKKLISELREHPEIILFIDEVHTIIGAGSSAGTLDAANILKPALARGEVQCIGATTLKEYRKTIEKDGALERRFQKVMLLPTSAETTLCILRNLRPRYEEHHSVRYSDDALKACVELSERYITDRSFPDKAIDVLDEAGSSAHLQGVNLNPPEEIAELREQVKRLTEEKSRAASEQAYEQAANLRDEIVGIEARIDVLTKEWKERQNTVCIFIDDTDIAGVVSRMTGIPSSRISSNESEKLERLNAALHQQVIGQREAIAGIYKSILRSRMGMNDPARPVGTFHFVGPTGVGKTHLVKTLAAEYFGNADALIRVDMSEFGEKHTTSRLVGAPPGYVGYDEGGQLTERVRRHPYSVVLFDEIEKAHPDVFNILLQVMDEGHLTDGNGVKIDFRNTIIVMTSNCGTRLASEFSQGLGFETGSSLENREKRNTDIVMKQLRRTFPPEFLGRLDDIIFFHQLPLGDIVEVARLQVAALVARLSKMGIKLSVSDAAFTSIAQAAADDKAGARALRSLIQKQIEDPLCNLLLEPGSTKNYRVDVNRNDKKECHLSIFAD